jgi:hypothetical protein
MSMKMIQFKPALLVILAVALLSYACTDVEDNSESASVLTVDTIEGEPGDDGGEDGTPLLSDVCDNPDEDPTICVVTNDNALVTFSNDFIQIGPGSGVGDPSFLNDIVVTQYRVDYVRPNNRNTPGVDVPFGIDGTMNVRVPVGGTATASILVVRHVAKEEPPLAGVAFEGEGVLTANAQIQFFGRDIAGRAVSAVGFLEIHFSDYGEE